MLGDTILIRFGEISTKGKNRKHFIEQLKKNVKLVLRNFNDIKYVSNRDRMLLRLNGENPEPISNQLKKVFGIQSFSLAVTSSNDLEEIKEKALLSIKETYSHGKTFKISTKRANKQFKLDSNEMNAEIGAHILKNVDGITVNVKEPDIHLRIEIREKETYLTFKDETGAGGLPVGSGGKAMLMLSGGIDSPVAGLKAMKRGIGIDVVHFFSPPYTSERAKQKVIDLTGELSRYAGSITLHIVPFTAIQERIQKQIPENYSMTATRRMMLKITDMIREKEGGLAIITGESLGQVASQTLESMYAINAVTSTPVLRPLIDADKNEIIEEAKRIGTYEISVRPYEDCCTIFTPSAPKTRPKKEKVERFESFVDFEELMKEATALTETIVIHHNETINQEFAGLF
jgi:thiamine biosynthesis protein ThiI